MTCTHAPFQASPHPKILPPSKFSLLPKFPLLPNSSPFQNSRRPAGQRAGDLQRADLRPAGPVQRAGRQARREAGGRRPHARAGPHRGGRVEPVRCRRAHLARQKEPLYLLHQHERAQQPLAPGALGAYHRDGKGRRRRQRSDDAREAQPDRPGRERAHQQVGRTGGYKRPEPGEWPVFTRYCTYVSSSTPYYALAGGCSAGTRVAVNAGSAHRLLANRPPEAGLEHQRAPVGSSLSRPRPPPCPFACLAANAAYLSYRPAPPELCCVPRHAGRPPEGSPKHQQESVGARRRHPGAAAARQAHPLPQLQAHAPA
eukprot:322941-Chlamydomonas_euryale.AAC.1